MLKVSKTAPLPSLLEQLTTSLMTTSWIKTYSKAVISDQKHGSMSLNLITNRYNVGKVMKMRDSNERGFLT